MMDGFDLMSALPGAATVCDLDGIVVAMNEKSADMFQRYGGKDLVGKSLLDCHPEPARSKLVSLLQTGESNVYTIEKNGVKKLIYQAPWHVDGKRSGMIECVLEIPHALPHFIR
jgi:transcriptional regulator with PAS, ATPase and Fis domain